MLKISLLIQSDYYMTNTFFSPLSIHRFKCKDNVKISIIKINNIIL
ncbi:unknown [Prevotella sp. CAG:1185]|nr:unknown [Prevotella sp. CAG:1185]